MGQGASLDCTDYRGDSKPPPIEWKPTSPPRAALMNKEMDPEADSMEPATARKIANQKIVVGTHCGKNGNYEKSKEYFTRSTDKVGGYALSTVNCSFYPKPAPIPFKEYIQAYKFKEKSKLIMEVDMTQTDHATLAYLLHDGQELVEKKHIACNDIDITKQYRLPTCFV